MIYNETAIQKVYEANLREAKRQLQNLPVCCSYEPSIPGLTGWILEQTIQHCIRRELDRMNLSAEVEEQVIIDEQATIDLLIGKTAIEITTSGLASEDDIVKHKNYQTQAKERGWRYVFLSISETTFRTHLIEALGKDNVILLENYDSVWQLNGEWGRFIGIIVDGL